MKTSKIFVVAMTFALSMNACAGETLLQTVNGDKADGGGEVKAEPKAESGKIARARKGQLSLWGVLPYHTERPVPAGKSIIRFRIYVDGQESALFKPHISISSGHMPVGIVFQVPAYAKAGSFINVDTSVDSPEPWSMIPFKKAEESDKPGPWIDTISVITKTDRQMIKGSSVFTQLDVKAEPKANSGKIAHIESHAHLWNFANFWLGKMVPAGKSIIRFRLYVDGQATADTPIYIGNSKGFKSPHHHVEFGKLPPPAGAKIGSFVDVDVPVDFPEEWDVVVVKKGEENDKPTPWIDTVSIVQP
jgi:hypothetical protein